MVIEKRVVEELKSLGMKQTTFKVNFEDKNVVLDGKDSVEFVFSANQGQDVKNLAKTASGGEASRIMLAIKNIFSSIDEVGTLVFDEDGNSHMKNIPGGNLMIAESEDYFKPESEKLMESAIKALS